MKRECFHNPLPFRIYDRTKELNYCFLLRVLYIVDCTVKVKFSDFSTPNKEKKISTTNTTTKAFLV